MIIRAANLADLENLTALFDAYRVWYRKPSDTKNAKLFLKERITKKQSIIFLACDDNNSIGFTQLYPSFSSTNLKKLWILNDLFIKKEYRGKGISKMLINTAKDLARKTSAGGILLETETSNLIGNNLYPSTGFKLEDNNFYFWTA